jgi:hypothetical protein
VHLRFDRGLPAALDKCSNLLHKSISKQQVLPMSPLRSNMTGKSLAISGVGTWRQSGRMRASLVVLESTETHEFSDATYVRKKSKYIYMRNQLIKQSKLERSSGAPLFYHRSLHKCAGDHIGLLRNPSFTAWLLNNTLQSKSSDLTYYSPRGRSICSPFFPLSSTPARAWHCMTTYYWTRPPHITHSNSPHLSTHISRWLTTM